MHNDTFLKACYRKSTEYTPVWIMRQAGRYLKEYRKLRKTADFLTMCKTPSLAAEATLLPVDIIGVDAAILFSDILIPVEAMGIEVKFTERKGPVLPCPVRKEKDIETIQPLNLAQSKERMPFIPEAIKIVLKDLKERVPLIGFSGAPFTLATYMVEGETSKNFTQIKRLMYTRPDLYHRLMEKISDTIISYLNMQIEAGVHAVQLFDTWAGLLAPDDYRDYALPYVKKVINGLKRDHIPVILFATGVSGFYEYMLQSGADVIGLDWRIDMGYAKDLSRGQVALQGNLDPVVLFADPGVIREYARRILDKFGPHNGHIFNLGHGILPETPADHAKALVDIVHEESIRIKRQV